MPSDEVGDNLVRVAESCIANLDVEVHTYYHVMYLKYKASIVKSSSLCELLLYFEIYLSCVI